MEKTTIQLNTSTLERLKLFKAHNRQSYDELLNIMIDDAESESLSAEEIKQIEKSLEEIKNGQVYSIAEVAKEFGVKL